MAVAEMTSPPIDLSMWLYMKHFIARRARKRGTGSEGNLASRIQSEELERLAAEQELMVLAHVVSRRSCLLGVGACYITLFIQVDFWAVLNTSFPSQQRLQRTGKALSEAIAHADQQYQRLLAANPKSPRALRAYAQFLLDVVNNQARGADMLQAADEEEEIAKREADVASRMKDMFVCVDSLSYTSNSLSVVKASVQWGHLGRITDANASGKCSANYRLLPL